MISLSLSLYLLVDNYLSSSLSDKVKTSLVFVLTATAL